jgi:hypothetical protein
MEIDSTDSSPIPSSSPESSVGSSRGTTPDIPDTKDHCYITQDEGMRTEGITVKNICCIGAGYVGEFNVFSSRPVQTDVSGQISDVGYMRLTQTSQVVLRLLLLRSRTQIFTSLSSIRIYCA